MISKFLVAHTSVFAMLLLIGLALFLHPRYFCLAYLLLESSTATKQKYIFVTGFDTASMHNKYIHSISRRQGAARMQFAISVVIYSFSVDKLFIG